MAEAWFRRHCGKAVLLGRLIPAVRTLISVPAGIARMAMGRFLAYSTLGTLVWSGLLAMAGYLLESQYTRVAEYMDPVSKLIIAVVILGYFYRLLTYRGGPADMKAD
jgi:membrane protein DedA with SNARE-associated domain